MAAKQKKVYRSKKDNMLSGAIAGIGEYFNIDATILRLAWVLVTIFTGIVPGVIAYLIAIIIIPNK